MGSDQDSAPIRVVVFTSGPTIRPSIQRFIVRLDEHQEIELAAVYCQSSGSSVREIVADLWRRRGWLALPLMAVQAAGVAGRFVAHPRETIGLRRGMASLQDRVRTIPDIHAPAVLESVRRHAPDLGLIYGSPILRPELFEIPARGTLGIHHGKVPKYRGKKTTFWAMYNGEPDAGVTIQKVNAGLDTGEVVEEGTVPTPGRSLGAVWRELEDLGYRLYIEAILAVKRGTATYRRPEGEKGALLRDPKPGHLLRYFWRRWTRRIRA